MDQAPTQSLEFSPIRDIKKEQKTPTRKPKTPKPLPEPVEKPKTLTAALVRIDELERRVEELESKNKELIYKHKQKIKKLKADWNDDLDELDEKKRVLTKKLRMATNELKKDKLVIEQVRAMAEKMCDKQKAKVNGRFENKEDNLRCPVHVDSSKSKANQSVKTI